MSSIRSILAMKPSQIQKISKEEFVKFTARNFPYLNEEQFISISESYFEIIKPSKLRMVDQDWLVKRKEKHATNDEKRNYYNTAINEAIREQKQLRRIKQFRGEELKVLTGAMGSFVTVDCVAARLDVSKRHIEDVAKEGFLTITKILRKNMMDVNLVCKYLKNNIHHGENTMLTIDSIPTLFRATDLTNYINKDPKTIIRDIHEKRVPYFRIGNRIRVRMEDIVDMELKNEK